MTTTWPLTTPRLALRPVGPGDLDRHFTDLPDGLSQLVVLHDDEIVGDLMLKVTDAWAQRDVADQARATVGVLGWVMSPGSTGRGLATEAVRELVRHAFEDVGLRRVVAECFADNEPSWRLMERIGMRREAHTVRDALHRDLGWQDGLAYALLAEEWRQKVDASMTKR